MPHTMADAEVLVCGAGPVGLACAFLLAEAGMAVALIDAAEAVDTSPRAAFHQGPTARALEQLGLMEDLAQNAFIGGQTGHWAPEFNYLRKISFDGIMVGQDTICDVLVQRLRAMPNVSLAMATELTALRQESDRVVVQLRYAGGERSLTCRWLVGADGARSAVRRTCGIAFDGHTWPDRVYAANIACDLAGQGLADAQFRADPRSWAVVVRLDRHGNWRVAFGDDGSEALADEIAGATARLAEFIPGGLPFDLLQLSPYRTHQRAASTMRQDRVLLIGDAAHISAPWGGLGLTMGFWDAFVLGDLLPEVAAGRIAPGALDAFSQERLRIFNEIVSPAVSENRRILQERDPARRREDIARFDALADSPEMQKAFGEMSRAFIGDPLVENSRWLA
jgi:2-polyprenyl-6-methoxyphenol hydroxylase-like FAD-dependent oxidoreductase